MPRWPEKTDTTEMKVGQDKEVVLPASGSIRAEVSELNTIEVVDKPFDNEQMSALAFMEEPVTIMVHESTDPFADNPVQVACNGVNQFFLRGEAQTVRRKYVEILARSKKTTISTPEIQDHDGARTNKIVQRTALKTPFSVINDPNPKGPAWLKQTLAEAA